VPGLVCSRVHPGLWVSWLLKNIGAPGTYAAGVPPMTVTEPVMGM
jgi:hypothetical protein